MLEGPQGKSLVGTVDDLVRSKVVEHFPMTIFYLVKNTHFLPFATWTSTRKEHQQKIINCHRNVPRTDKFMEIDIKHPQYT